MVDTYPIRTHRPWPVSPVQYPLTGAKSNSVYAPEDRPQGLQTFKAHDFTLLPRPMERLICVRYYGFVWLGIGLVWWPKVREL